MNRELLASLISQWPDANQKEQLEKKLQRMSSSDANSLHDFLSMEPTGHIAIQMQNESGAYETVLEQPNLIVKGSEDILFRSFAGDGAHVLYKNRMPKNGSITIQIESSNFVQDVTKGSDVLKKLTMNPQALWTEIAKNYEDQFDVSYGFDPVILYISKDQSSTNYVQKIIISTQEQLLGTSNYIKSYAPLMPEIYSTQTNLFMALGEGISRSQLTHESLVKSGTWSTTQTGALETSQPGSKITMTKKVNYVKLTFATSATHGIWKVTVNGGSPILIDTSNASNGSVELNNLLNQSQNGESIIVIEADSTTIASNQTWTLTDLEADFFDVTDNGLIQEFTNYTTKFLTPRYYSTSTTPPFAIQLPHEAIVAETLVMKKGNVTFTRVTDIAQISSTHFYLDEQLGQITFGNIVSNIETTYEVTGQRHLHINTSGKSVRFNHEIVSIPADAFLNGILSYAVPFAYSENESDIYIRGIDADNGDALVFQKSTNATPEAGTYSIDAQNKKIIIHFGLNPIYEEIELLLLPLVNPGYETNYRRGLLLKPKTGPDYPWYSLDENKVTFVAEFGEFLQGVNPSNQKGRMIDPVTIREMMLISGPRTEDYVPGYTGWPNKAFSLIRIPETVKDPKTGMRILWTIQLSFSQA